MKSLIEDYSLAQCLYMREQQQGQGQGHQNYRLLTLAGSWRTGSLSFHRLLPIRK